MGSISLVSLTEKNSGLTGRKTKPKTRSGQVRHHLSPRVVSTILVVAIMCKPDAKKLRSEGVNYAHGWRARLTAFLFQIL
ncbi:MAG: hypothetical protein WB773_18615, partial [Isosphaeraceae bacterium]